MKQQIQALIAEILKNRHSKISWVTFIAFSLAPVFSGVFMLMMKDNGYEGLSGILRSKAVVMSFEANWSSYLGILTQAVGVGGILIFGFVSSWLFGREYSEGTAKDLLALPISRTKILNAKFIYYILWCLALVIFNLVLGLLIGSVLQLPGWELSVFTSGMKIYFTTTFLIILLNAPVSFFALVGRGYLAPLGIVAVLLVFSQILAAVGLGIYFPWSVPGIYSGGGGADLKLQLNTGSYLSVVITGIIGYMASLLWWKYADQSV